MRLLVVEDEDAIAEPLVEGLEREGFDVARAATGAEALQADPADLVLLDLRLPDMDGYAVCRELRSRSGVPIIMVTAKGEEVDRVIGLELGADDYVVKPFGLRELVARIRAVSRRAGGQPGRSGILRAGPIEVGMAIAEMIVERRFQRKSMTTNAARSDPTMRCSSTLWMEASMNSAPSRTMRIL